MELRAQTVPYMEILQTSVTDPLITPAPPLPLTPLIKLITEFELILPFFLFLVFLLFQSVVESAGVVLLLRTL